MAGNTATGTGRTFDEAVSNGVKQLEAPGTADDLVTATVERISIQSGGIAGIHEYSVELTRV